MLNRQHHKNEAMRERKKSHVDEQVVVRFRRSVSITVHYFVYSFIHFFYAAFYSIFALNSHAFSSSSSDGIS